MKTLKFERHILIEIIKGAYRVRGPKIQDK